MTNAENPDYTIPVQLSENPDLPENDPIPADPEDFHFRDLKLLGMGGMGVVYEADDPVLERKVALKMLRSPYRNDRGQTARFIKEARITAKIDHPNIIAVHHLGTNPECGAYFSMRRIKGETLQTILRRLREKDPAACRQYTLRRLLDIFVAACNGVAAAHQQGIYHCDLKPSNIMVGIRGEVWVLDWGVAREKSDPLPDPPQNTVEGTPAFMAPELLNGEVASPDEKSDIYALGAILYCILTWREAPVDLTLERSELIKNAAAGKILPLRAPGKEQILQVELAAICRKMMAKKRENRYPDINAALNDIHNYMDGMPVSAYSPGIFYRLLKLCRRRPLIPICLAVAAATLLLYHIAVRYMDYADDCSRLRQAYFNAGQAREYANQSLRCWNILTSVESGIAPLQITINGRDMILSANMALMESFAAFDSAAGASPAAAESFVINSGADTLKRLLRLQIITADDGVARNTAERFQLRWQKLFEQANKIDPEIPQLLQLLQAGYGRLRISGESANSFYRCTLIQEDGTSMPMVFRDANVLTLPAGRVNLHFTGNDGSSFAAFFQLSPGALVRFVVPDAKIPSGFILIPQDHWFADIQGVGRQLKRLPGFLISASEVGMKMLLRVMEESPEFSRHKNLCRSVNGKAMVTAGVAESYCIKVSKKMKMKLHLPEEMELRKSLAPGNLPGESFYGAKALSADIPLFVRRRNGKTAIFDPATMKTRPALPGDVAAIRLVAELK